jgi:TM2 domain-containing membrane protein YozV
MDMVEQGLMNTMSDQQRQMFLMQMNGVKKDSTVGVVLALCVGGVGAHHFYLGKTGVGIVYALFFWTFIPACVAFIEAFLMPERVKEYNARKAMEIAQAVKMMYP